MNPKTRIRVFRTFFTKELNQQISDYLKSLEPYPYSHKTETTLTDNNTCVTITSTLIPEHLPNPDYLV